MKPFLKAALIIIAAGVLVAGLVVAFVAGHKEAAADAEQDKPVKAPSRVEVVGGETVVKFDEADRDRGGVALAPLAAVRRRRELHAYGTVLDPQELIDLRIALESGQAQLNKAQSAHEVATQDYLRARDLYDRDQNISKKVLQAAQGTMLTEQANIEIAQAALRATQATAAQHWGQVIGKWITGPATHIDQLASREAVIVQVTLAPGDQEIGASPDAMIQAADGALIPATFVAPSPRTDPKIQGLSFFYLVGAAHPGTQPAPFTRPENQAGGGANGASHATLLPGMNVVALVSTGRPRAGVIIPRSAVVWLQGNAWAYVRVKPDQFARRVVSTNEPAPAGYFEQTGFSPGDTIVIQGPQILLSEEFRSSIEVLGD